MLSFANFRIAFPVYIAAISMVSSFAESTDSIVTPQYDCPQDIQLFDVDGVTKFPEKVDRKQVLPVTIVSQSISNVTVELRQQWFPSVDSIHYAFKGNNSRIKCYEETLVNMDSVFDTITIECNAKSPWGHLEVCLSDDVPGENLLDGDDADLPKSCQKVFPGCCQEERPRKPTVCYALQIRCESLCVKEVARKRGLKKESPNSWLRGS